MNTYRHADIDIHHVLITTEIVSRYKIQDGFIAFSCIQLYTYRHAQYLSSLRYMIQVQDITLI